MKTRREFFKVFAGSCAVLAACVVAPRSLMLEPKLSAVPLADLTLDDKVVTSGYMRIDSNGNIPGYYTTTTNTTILFNEDGSIKHKWQAYDHEALLNGNQI